MIGYHELLSKLCKLNMRVFDNGYGGHRFAHRDGFEPLKCERDFEEVWNEQ